MSWSFEISLLVFLLMVFISQALASKLSSYIPMPLILGIISILGFTFDLLPKDIVVKSNMMVVGTIAYNMFVVNSGTMIDLKFIKKYKTESIICIISSIMIFLIIGIGMKRIIGKDLALLSSGSVIGGGATCAIASYMTFGIKPEIAVYPWMIFMFQGLFAIPVIIWSLKKEAALILKKFRENPINTSETKNVNVTNGEKIKPYQKIHLRYKTTAYYLVYIMAINILNKYAHAKLNIGISHNVTALLAGFLFNQMGLIDPGPLYKSDTFGLLLLGLMGLMVNTLSNNPLGNILRLMSPLIIVFIVSVVVLLAEAYILSKYFKRSIYGVIAMNFNCLMGFPVNNMLVEKAASIGQSTEEKKYISMKLTPLMSIGTMLVVNIISIIITALTVNYIK